MHPAAEVGVDYELIMGAKRTSAAGVSLKSDSDKLRLAIARGILCDPDVFRSGSVNSSFFTQGGEWMSSQFFLGAIGIISRTLQDFNGLSYKV